mmetsp:Transcript_16790/g.20716  ORF Transcript_16790/g.20716 Transcript_16790/m.20716 type:complete len:81 (+) Transcript_16790:435-677(+)
MVMNINKDRGKDKEGIPLTEIIMLIDVDMVGSLNLIAIATITAEGNPMEEEIVVITVIVTIIVIEEESLQGLDEEDTEDR